ncbi:hypothetical protein [Neorhizobium sp. P12A]|uniref:hypothetical protein n=1 Tax=Neorhizobium sp. P12A TaxID=2268027 RepID=UPI0011EF60EE|nr:hypothetical protein [Neorhizobium sp. P12A]
MTSVLLFAVVAALSGSAFWFWLNSALAAATHPGVEPDMQTSELDLVSDADIADALKTVGGTPALLDRFKPKDAGCPLPLAWISIRGAPGQPPTSVRLRSGAYLSPAFKLTDVPVRVAIPFPAPYDIGKGQLTVLGTGATASIALTPPWQVAFNQSNTSVHNVSWRAIKRCTDSNG